MSFSEQLRLLMALPVKAVGIGKDDMDIAVRAAAPQLSLRILLLCHVTKTIGGSTAIFSDISNAAVPQIPNPNRA
jgi:hypothetical protein